MILYIVFVVVKFKTIVNVADVGLLPPGPADCAKCTSRQIIVLWMVYEKVETLLA